MITKTAEYMLTKLADPYETYNRVSAKAEVDAMTTRERIQLRRGLEKMRAKGYKVNETFYKALKDPESIRIKANEYDLYNRLNDLNARKKTQYGGGGLTVEQRRELAATRRKYKQVKDSMGDLIHTSPVKLPEAPKPKPYVPKPRPVPAAAPVAPVAAAVVPKTSWVSRLAKYKTPAAVAAGAGVLSGGALLAKALLSGKRKSR